MAMKMNNAPKNVCSTLCRHAGIYAGVLQVRLIEYSNDLLFE